MTDGCVTTENGTTSCQKPGRIVNCADIRIVPNNTAVPTDITTPNYTDCDWFIERSLCNRNSPESIVCGQEPLSTTTITPLTTAPFPAGVNPLNPLLPVPIIPFVPPVPVGGVIPGGGDSSGSGGSMLPLLALMMGGGFGGFGGSRGSSATYVVPYSPYNTGQYGTSPISPYPIYQVYPPQYGYGYWPRMF